MVLIEIPDSNAQFVGPWVSVQESEPIRIWELNAWDSMLPYHPTPPEMKSRMHCCNHADRF